MTLDRTPFQRGLAQARAEAEAFERNEIDLKADVDTAPARRGLASLGTAADGSNHKVGLLAASIIALGPAAIAAGGVAAGALAPLTLGIAGLAAVALPVVKDLHAAATKTGKESAEAIARLGPGAGPAVEGLKALLATWQEFRQSLSPDVFAFLNATFGLLRTSLPALAPLIRGTAQAMTGLMRGLTPLGPVFGRAFTAMLPIVNQVTRGILSMAQGLARWTQGKGFEEFIAYVQQVGPQLVQTLGAFGRLFIQMGIAGAPLLPVLAQLATALANILTAILRIPGAGTAIVTLGALGVVGLKAAQGLVFLGARADTVRKAIGLLGPAIVRLRAVAVIAFTAIGRAAMLLFANPIGLAIAGVIAATVLIIKNWDKVKGALKAIWGAIKDAAKALLSPLFAIVTGPLQKAWDWIKGLAPKFLRAGEELIRALVKGIGNMAMAPVNAVKGILGKARDLLPFSEPKDASSPLRGLGRSGEAIMKNLAAGISRSDGPAGATRRQLRNLRRELNREASQWATALGWAKAFQRQAAGLSVRQPRFAHAHAFGGNGIVGSTVINRPLGDTYNQTINVHGPAGRSADPRSTAIQFADEVRRRPPGRKG